MRSHMNECRTQSRENDATASYVERNLNGTMLRSDASEVARWGASAPYRGRLATRAIGLEFVGNRAGELHVEHGAQEHDVHR